MLHNSSSRRLSPLPSGLRTALVGALIVTASLSAARAASAQDPRKALQDRKALASAQAERVGWRAPPAHTMPECVTVPTLDPEDVDCATMVSVFGGPASNFADPRRTRVTIPWATVVQRPSDRLRFERAPIENGFEPPPRWQIEVDREFFVLLADLTDTNITMRTYGDDLEETRAWHNLLEDERASERATYLEVEEFMGHSEENSMEGPWLTGGMSLAALSGVLAAVDHDEAVISENLELRLRPRFWPPGLRLKGTFGWP